MKVSDKLDSTLEEAIKLPGDAEASLDQLFYGFLDRLRHRQDAILLVLGRGDTATALRLLHQLQGTSAMYGVHELTQQANEITNAITRADLRTAVVLTRSLDDPRLVFTA